MAVKKKTTTSSPAKPRKPAVAAKKSAAVKAKPAAPTPPKASIAPAAAPAATAPAAPTAPVADQSRPKKDSGKKEKKATGDDHGTGKKKMVRDSFTMPAPDYALIGVLKARTLSSGTSVKKSELLRAGLVALAAMPAAQLIGLVASMPAIKTGRPGEKKK